MEYIIDCNMAGSSGGGSSGGAGAPLPAGLSETLAIPTLTDTVDFALVTV
jgi:hypothetical protein